MKKKIACLFMMLVICISVFAGCNLFERNLESYYEATVATIKYKDGSGVDKITKRELLLAFDSYGQNYITNYGYTAKKAVTETLNTVIENKLKAKYVKDYYAEKNEDGSLKHGELFTTAEKTYLWDNTYESVYGMLKDYYFEATNTKAPTASTSEEPSTNNLIINKYSSPTYFGTDKNGNVVIKLYEVEKALRDSYVVTTARDFEKTLDGGVRPDKEIMYNKLLEPIGNKITQSEKNWGKAFDLYIKRIKENYEYEKFKNDKETFMFELDRVYNIIKDNYLVEKYNEIYQSNSNFSQITADEVLQSYTEKVRADYTKYKVKGDVSGYESAMLSNPGDVDYILEGTGVSNFFYVGYVKMEFSESQKADLNELNDKVEDKSFYGDYDDELNAIYNRTKATIRDRKTGEKTSEKIDASVLLKDIEYAVKGDYLKEGDINEQEGRAYTKEEIVNLNNELAQGKADAFKEYLYYYNDDDTLKNADYNATFGVSASGDILASEKFDTDEIKSAIKKLFNNGKAEIGDITGLVKAEDGYYVFFFAGNIKNPIAVSDNFNATTQPNDNIRTLANTKLNIFSEKTLFDKLYSELGSDLMSPFLNEHIIYLKSLADCKAIENNIKDLY